MPEHCACVIQDIPFLICNYCSRANAKFDISDELARAYQEINQALNNELTPQARLVGNLSNFGPGRIRVRKTGMEAAYRVNGEVMVVVNPF